MAKAKKEETRPLFQMGKETLIKEIEATWQEQDKNMLYNAKFVALLQCLVYISILNRKYTPNRR